MFMTKNRRHIIDQFYSGETEAQEESILRNMIKRADNESDMSAEKAYFDFIDNNKIDIPEDIESIAVTKIKEQERQSFKHKLKIWAPRLSAAAILVIVFLIIKPNKSSNDYISQHLSDSEKKEYFEDALKVVNSTISGEKPEPEVLYDDEKFKIVIE
eukprot:Anaeramoba_ignava/a484057_19.p3 GENE.a484057_19~~a484057_19.p3  ORF type:complete len:157 (-),score=3.57 a484057_19:1313-1783(-)